MRSIKPLTGWMWTFLTCLLIPAPGLLFGADTPRRPNVIFVLSDDQNGDTLGCFGAKVLTPNIDRLAGGGVRFTRAYTVHSVCTPSRYTCLTGQYASRSRDSRFLQQCPPGTQANVGFNVEITPDTPNLARTLHQAGYATGFVGKWHTGKPALVPFPQDGKLDDPQVARALAENQRRMVEYIKSCGFDYAASVYKGNLADHRLTALDVHNMEWVTKGALDFIEQNQTKPFFLHICPTLQHAPAPRQSLKGDPRITPAGLLPGPLDVQPPRASIVERVRAAGLDESTVHATWLDDGIGAVWKKVEELGLANNTLFLYFSDNGTLRGKGTCYDGGARTPAFLSWKGHVPAGETSDELVANIDFAPTILEACGVTPPAGMILDGQSLLPLLSGEARGWRDSLFLEIGHTRGIVTRRWKFLALRYPPAPPQAAPDQSLDRSKRYHMDSPLNLQRTAEAAHPGYWDADQLYDLEKDPTERVNLAAKPENGPTLARMRNRLETSQTKLGRPFGVPEVRKN